MIELPLMPDAILTVLKAKAPEVLEDLLAYVNEVQQYTIIEVENSWQRIADEEYQRGYDNGCDTGYQDAYDRYQQELSEDTYAAYQDGYSEGFSQGYDSGTDESY